MSGSLISLGIRLITNEPTRSRGFRVSKRLSSAPATAAIYSPPGSGRTGRRNRWLPIAVSLVALALMPLPPLSVSKADECLTKAEARHKFRGETLYWHTSAHCWDDQKVTRDGSAPPRASPPVSDLERPAPGAPAAEIAFPSLLPTREMPVPGLPSRIEWFSPRSMTGWPLVYDYDEPEFKPWTRIR